MKNILFGLASLFFVFKSEANVTCMQEGVSNIFIKCPVNLELSDDITKRVIIKGSSASGTTIDCRGKTLHDSIRIEPEFKLVDGKHVFYRPENITVKNCIIKNGFRLRSTDSSQNVSYPLRESSRLTDHVENLQKSSPTKITFENVDVWGGGSVAIYIEPGATNFTLRNSRVYGSTKDVAMYLGIEGKGHVIEGNDFHIYSTKREIIAVDGVKNSIIKNNTFHYVRHGGVFLYRNCGEKGIIRHQTPTDNVITGNTFYLKEKFTAPAIWVSSRNRVKDEISFCWQDKNLAAGGFTQAEIDNLMNLSFKSLDENTQKRISEAPRYNIGSSFDNRDFAISNTVTLNTVIKPVEENFTPSIWVRGEEKNNVGDNVISTTRKTKESCFLKGAYPSQEIKHGESSYHMLAGDAVKCSGVVLTCYDGTIEKIGRNCQKTTHRISCSKSENSSNCQKEFTCPPGKLISEIRGICRFGNNAITISQQQKQMKNRLSVLNSNGKIGDFCEAGASKINTGSTLLQSVLGKDSIKYDCSGNNSYQKICVLKMQVACE